MATITITSEAPAIPKIILEAREIYNKIREGVTFERIYIEHRHFAQGMVGVISTMFGDEPFDEEVFEQFLHWTTLNPIISSKDYAITQGQYLYMYKKARGVSEEECLKIKQEFIDSILAETKLITEKTLKKYDLERREEIKRYIQYEKGSTNILK